MMQSYQDPKAALKYLEFLNSPDGKIQQSILLAYLKTHLPEQKDMAVLDVGCGSGWLIKALSEKFSKLSGCDISPELIAEAKKNFPAGNFMVADICKTQAFNNENFDVIILNMVAHDLENQKNAFLNIQKMLKPKGLMLLTIINPYYAFPAGQWKRGWLRFLLGKKPKLILEAYNSFAKKDRQFFWQKNIPGYFYTLPETINNALSANFKLTRLEEVTAKEDSKNFDLNYRLYRFPIILLLKFVKPSTAFDNNIN